MKKLIFLMFLDLLKGGIKNKFLKIKILFLYINIFI
jgi:hypothetical protein